MKTFENYLFRWGNTLNVRGNSNEENISAIKVASCQGTRLPETDGKRRRENRLEKKASKGETSSFHTSFQEHVILNGPLSQELENFKKERVWHPFKAWIKGWKRPFRASLARKTKKAPRYCCFPKSSECHGAESNQTNYSRGLSTQSRKISAGRCNCDCQRGAKCFK